VILGARQADAIRVRHGKIDMWSVGYQDVATALKALDLED
jgi:hypothetical protein